MNFSDCKDRYKFRVWDTENEAFQHAFADTCYIDHDAHFVCVFWGDERPTEYVPENEAIVEMCIGLKDKTGALIFCGDILRDGDKMWEVCWSQSLASYMLDDYEYNEDGEYCGSGNLETIHSDDGLSLDMEIVGNIHEGILKK